MRHATNGRTRPALVVRHQKVRLSYGELRQQVDRLAAGLLTLGLDPGDRIGIWSPNNREWVLTQFATAKAGLILVNINPSYRIAELEYALNKVGCKALILAERFKTSDYVGMLRELAPELGHATPGKLEAARLPALRSVVLLGDGWHPGTLRFSEILARGGAAEAQAHRRARAAAAIRRADQYPVHLRHHRLSQRRDAVASQHPQQRLLHRRGDAADAARIACAFRCRSITASAWCWATSRR